MRVRGRPLAPRRTRVLPLPVFVLIALWGCAGLPPAPQREWVLLETSRSIQYYSVRGTTTTAIFDDIDRNGLFDTKARRAIGLTSAELRIDWKTVETRPAPCSLESMTIRLDLVVTLPRHDQLSELSPDVRVNWQRFAARVAAHEQRHVDIYLDGAKMMKTRLEKMPTESSSCSELDRVIRSIWAGQQADTDRAQEEFHLADDAKIQNDREPLRVQLDLRQTRLSAIKSEIRGLDQTLDDLRRQRDMTHVEIDTVKAEMVESGATSSACSQSGLTSQVQALCHRHNALVVAHNAIVGQHAGAVAHRNNLADEHNRIVAIVNELIEELNWLR